jgi:hypothetical protein
MFPTATGANWSTEPSPRGLAELIAPPATQQQQQQPQQQQGVVMQGRLQLDVGLGYRVLVQVGGWLLIPDHGLGTLQDVAASPVPVCIDELWMSGTVLVSFPSKLVVRS